MCFTKYQSPDEALHPARRPEAASGLPGSTSIPADFVTGRSLALLLFGNDQSAEQQSCFPGTGNGEAGGYIIPLRLL